jgi:hypothetical protein
MRVVLKSLLRTGLLLTVAAVVLGMVLPYSTITAVLHDFVLVRRLIDFLYTVAPHYELEHLLSFAALGLTAHFAWRNGRFWHVATGILCLGAIVEIVQIWIPGREAAVSHALLDFVGGIAGYGVAWIFTYAWGTEGLPEDYRHSTRWIGDRSDH